ncbi:MAG TPA: cation:proton antiporter [Blastocatellia bacterium]|nr:cation:proton antiporter [Blastocatellia bacterium]
MSNFELSLLLFLELAVILGACRVFGWLARAVGQPQVMGEIIAGIALGPSLFGLVLPGLQAALFPPASMTIIYAVSKVGLVLYMFLIGVEFDAEVVKRRLTSAVSVSFAGMIVPFLLGGLLGLYLFGYDQFFAGGVSRWIGAAFLGAAMSITAFPVLARILQERRLTSTPLGSLVLAAGSIDDASAWCVLAIVLASFTGDATGAVLAIGGAVVYVAVVLVGGRPLLRRLAGRVERDGRMTTALLSFVLMLLMLCAWTTDRIGIYEVFGAFILGVAQPRGLFAEELRRLVEPLTTSLLLPLFFVYSGLNTSIGLVDSLLLWLVTGAVLLAACLGKGVACGVAASVTGHSRRESIQIGVLMNTRGLMELIILNIGLERGIITPTLFAIMVIMAVVTTLMASPLFEMTIRRDRPPERR